MLVLYSSQVLVYHGTNSQGNCCSQVMNILFFFFWVQMGKFYELFEMDAHIGAKELDLQYMKVLELEGLSLC